MKTPPTYIKLYNNRPACYKFFVDIFSKIALEFYINSEYDADSVDNEIILSTETLIIHYWYSQYVYQTQE